MTESQETPVLVGVEITEDKVREILDLPKEVVKSSRLLENKGVRKRFVYKYLYLFSVLMESRRRVHIADLAIAYKMRNGHMGYYDCLPYGDAYPELMPILFLAWGFGLIKIQPALSETSSFPVDITMRGIWTYVQVANDVKKGRSTDYPTGHLKTYEDVNREWEEMMAPIMEEARQKAAQKANEMMNEEMWTGRPLTRRRNARDY